MRKIGMDELRQKQMEVLDYVAALCDENGIRIGLRAAPCWGPSGTRATFAPRRPLPKIALTGSSVCWISI